MELCPGYISTPQVLEARALLGLELKNRNTIEPGNSCGQKSPGPDSGVSLHEEPLSVPSPTIPENAADKVSSLKIGTSPATAVPKIMKDPVEANETQAANKTHSRKDFEGDRVEMGHAHGGGVYLKKLHLFWTNMIA